MGCSTLIVVPRLDGWFVEGQRLRQGPYPSHDLALRVAFVEAANRRHNGRRAKVSVQDSEGTVRTELCLCGVDASERNVNRGSNPWGVACALAARSA